ncbi:MAG TPA: hypothetical protein VFQ88_00040 [Nevskiaceae bacterium]|nr:hypothetical protein [Nevskiaceae bacterium]
MMLHAPPTPHSRHRLPAIVAALRQWLRTVLTPIHLKRTLLIALVVGTWLNLFNHLDQLLRGAINLPLAVKLALNYVTPFVVSNIGLLARHTRRLRKGRE